MRTFNDVNNNTLAIEKQLSRFAVWLRIVGSCLMHLIFYVLSLNMQKNWNRTRNDRGQVCSTVNTAKETGD
jgi:hypothetical protein